MRNLKNSKDDINKVDLTFMGAEKYIIYSAAACNKGKRRSINQDNFWFAGKYLKAKNNGLKKNKHKRISIRGIPAFAVFDGMGGEQYGESAAYIAAKTFNKLYRGFKKGTGSIKEFLELSCMQINHSLTKYAEQKGADCVGTTAAIIMFGEESGEKKVYACNVGDSRIFRYNGRKLTQISEDHVASDFFGQGKPPLTQFLGIPENRLTIVPHMTDWVCSDGDLYLICSDGLTDMIKENEIEKILSENKDMKSCASILLSRALENGGNDNITIILCRVLYKQNNKKGLNNNG